MAAAKFKFPANFDVAKQRAYRAKGTTKVIVADIPQAILNIAYMEPSAEADPLAGRKELALALAEKLDFPIDAPVDVWGWGAANTHKSRAGYNYATTPDITENYEIMVFNPEGQ